MTYNQTIEFLYAQLPVFEKTGKAAYKANLDNIVALCSFLGNPQQSVKCIHVAGTNGKGSVSHMLASVLQGSGYKTGLYTSPHLLNFRERIKINGEMVSETFVVGFIQKCMPAIDAIKPSFFELVTAMAFQYFYENNVEIAVIETGLGGRLDSTNIINPVLSVITNISFDHADILGNSLQLIAAEKAGIIKKGVPVVIGETNNVCNFVFEQKATEAGSVAFFADLEYETSLSGYFNEYQVIEVKECKTGNSQVYRLDLAGACQLKNLKTALCAIKNLIQTGFKINAIAESLACTAKRTGLMGRWQVLGHQPLIIADTGHNEAGIIECMKQLNGLKCGQMHIVFGMMADKDLSSVLKHLPENANYYFTKASLPRALDAEILAKLALGAKLNGTCYTNVELAIKAAIANAAANDVIFIGGSTFVVADALVFLNRKSTM